MLKPQTFTFSHADNSPFIGEGLRAFFERHMGIPEAMNGQFGAHVIWAVLSRRKQVFLLYQISQGSHGKHKAIAL